MKYWARSGSLAFARDCAPGGERAINAIRWNGLPVHYRAHTGDVDLIHQILLKPGRKKEYRFPTDLAPSVILDIGANIGATALLLRRYYPNARILAFEPEPGNFEVLRRNTESDAKIEIFNVALGNGDAEMDLILEDDTWNLGGFSLRSFGSKTTSSVKVKVRHSGHFLRELGVDRVDLIKIDTEGAERDILLSLPRELLLSVQWICGELHGVDDFALLKELSDGFEIGIRKSWFDRLAHFEACRKGKTLRPF